MVYQHFHNCESPRLVRNKYTKELVEVPCGVCPSCLLRRNTHYVPLLIREASCHKYVIFFTLTYADFYLPLCDLHALKVPDKYKVKYFDLYDKSKDYIKFCNYRLPFCPSVDAQKFIKRLREIIFRELRLRSVLRYFISADYGSTTFRPHWHGLLFFSDERLRKRIKEFVSRAWSVESCGKRYVIGRIDVQDSYGAAKYVSHYVRAIVDRPLILSFRAFFPRALFSSSPSLGSMAQVIESDQEIILNGLTEIHKFDPISAKYLPERLNSYYVRRLFPAVPSFTSLSRTERYRLYDIFLNYAPGKCRKEGVTFTAENRRIALRWRMLHDSFFRDYITLNDCSLSVEQINKKLDCVHYVVKRLLRAASSFGCSIIVYDAYIEKYLYNKSMDALKHQFEIESMFVDCDCPLEQLPSFIDISKPLVGKFSNFDTEYFVENRKRFNKSIKRKLDNAYLELHPQFKQFHL